MNVWVNMDDRTMINSIKELPESPMKNDLMKIVNETYPGRPLDRQAIADISSRYQYMSGEGSIDAARAFRKGNYRAKPYNGQNEYLKEMSLTVPYSELTKRQKASYLYNKLISNVNTGSLGQVGIQGIADLHGRDHGNVNYDNTDEFKRQKKYFKETRGKDWLMYPSMAPKQKEGDPAWEAYKELMNEYGIKAGE